MPTRRRNRIETAVEQTLGTVRRNGDDWLVDAVNARRRTENDAERCPGE